MAGAITLLGSILPDVILREGFKLSLPWLFWAKLAFLGATLILALAWKAVRPLWPFSLVLITLLLSEWFFQNVVAVLPQWQHTFGSGSFTRTMLGAQLLRLGAALVMVLLMLALKRNWRAFFLVKGDLKAIARPIPLLMDKPTTWVRLGWILALCISGGTLVFLLIAGRPSLASLRLALPLLPAVLVLAAMNAFYEETSYRAGPLATLHESIGAQPALLLTAVFFGIGHYYGVPYGIAGVVMASVLGWLLGKSMLETRGFFWAWFIHFLQDVLIFSFMAIGLVTPGGS